MKRIYQLFLLLVLTNAASAQTLNNVATNGSAVDFGGGLIRMTQSTNGVQKASVFSKTKIDLSQSFDMSFEMFFGCESGANGGDGMVFAMHNDPRGTAALGAGYGELGYAGVTKIWPSVAIEFDTYKGSPQDIADDHTAILKNGDVVNHFPSPISIGADLEDCSILGLNSWVMRMVWNSTTKTISQYINGNLMFSYTEDFVSTIFGGKTLVYWGFTGATGNATNEQWIAPVGAIIPWQCQANSCCVPFNFNIVKPSKICTPGSVILGTDKVFKKYLWSNGDTTATTAVTTSGQYCVSVVQDQAGSMCPSQTCITIEVPAYTATNGLYCNSTSLLSVTGASTYNWFDTIGGTLLGAGPSFATPVLAKGAGTKSYYVRDASLVADVAGGAASGFGSNNYSNVAFYADAVNTNLKFKSAADMTINSIDVEVNFWPACANANITLNLKDAGGALIKSFTKNFTCPGSAPYVKTVTLPVNFSLLAGTSYQIDAGGSASVISCYPSLAVYPIVQNNITLTGSAVGQRFPAFYNWNISLDYGCFTEVKALENCPLCIAPFNASLSPTDTSLCGSTSQPLTVTIGNGNAATYVYTFYKKGTPNKLVQAQSTNSTYTAISSGVYFAVIGDQADTSTCKLISNEAKVTLNALPIANAGADTSICIGESMILKASGGKNYLWENGSIAALRSISPVTTGSYSVTATSDSGCVANDTVTVTVNSKPIAKIKYLNDSICAGATMILDASGQNNMQYKWSTGSIDSAITVSSTKLYLMELTNVFGCQSRDSIRIIVSPLPAPSIANHAICAGDPAAIFDAGKYSSYLWSANGTGVLQSTSGTKAGNYTCQVTDTNGCKASATGVLTVNALPLPKISGDTSFCDGEKLTLNSGLNNTSLNYKWYPSLQSTSSILVEKKGQYILSVTDTIGCEGRDTMNVLNVYPLPTVSLGSNIVICDNGFGSETLSASYSGTSVLNWSTLENNVDSIVIHHSGAYWVQVIDSNQCENTDSIEVASFCEDCELEFPNVITTNDDGVNDAFVPKHCKSVDVNVLANVEWINFVVYDRWGLLIYASGNGVLPFWNGTFNGSKVPDGTYYFIVRYLASSGKEHEAVGFITVL
ncbi:MAG: gliding motility-associated C-terminal domain-containing protein [Bacteroidetes bacterium]|nr:gliding motility-associated C-terminal domain-containing protein [Bacteroidota bacterium]